MIQWVTPPSVLSRNIELYGQRVLQAVYIAARYWGQLSQDDARRNAAWEDRTGNARSGLFFAVDGFGMGPVVGEVEPGALAGRSDVAIEEGDDEHIVIILGHTVYYGKWLELARGGRYAIVMSTIERNLPELERLLQEIFR